MPPSPTEARTPWVQKQGPQVDTTSKHFMGLVSGAREQSLQKASSQQPPCAPFCVGQWPHLALKKAGSLSEMEKYAIRITAFLENHFFSTFSIFQI